MPSEHKNTRTASRLPTTGSFESDGNRCCAGLVGVESANVNGPIRPVSFYTPLRQPQNAYLADTKRFSRCGNLDCNQAQHHETGAGTQPNSKDSVSWLTPSYLRQDCPFLCSPLGEARDVPRRWWLPRFKAHWRIPLRIRGREKRIMNLPHAWTGHNDPFVSEPHIAMPFRALEPPGSVASWPQRLQLTAKP